MMVQPSEGSFDDPVTRKDNEALLIIGVKHGLKSKAAALGNPIQDLTTITAINPDQTELLAGAWQTRDQ